MSLEEGGSIFILLSLFACSTKTLKSPSIHLNHGPRLCRYTGTAVGETIQTGSIDAGVGNFAICGDPMEEDDTAVGNQWSGNEALLSWTAPSTGTYTIYTYGSTYDTALTVKDGCDGAVLGCDDDGGADLDSLVSIDAIEGQAYFIIVDAYDESESGSWAINIKEGNGEGLFPDDTGWHDSGIRLMPISVMCPVLVCATIL